jgi:hypothetical protein
VEGEGKGVVRVGWRESFDTFYAAVDEEEGKRRHVGLSSYHDLFSCKAVFGFPGFRPVECRQGYVVRIQQQHVFGHSNSEMATLCSEFRGFWAASKSCDTTRD